MLPDSSNPRAHQEAGEDLIDAATACEVLGGKTSPIHPATLYRGIAAKRFPAPIKIGPKTNRWRRTECEAVLRALADQRSRKA